jgi:cell division protein FtsW (lipid II flippase)
MGKNEVFWGIISFVLILIAYLVPYTVLSEVAKWYGSFLFWVLIAVVIIGVNYVLTRDWRDE